MHVNTFYSWILLYISPMTAVNISILSVLYITHLLHKNKTYRSLQVYQRSYSQVGHRVSSDLKRVSLLKLSDKILPGRSESESLHLLSVLYITHLLQLYYMIRMFLYAQIYWLVEFGDVSCLQFTDYLRECHS
jgi:hypothetical protein